MTIQRPDGEVVEKLNPKFTGFGDFLFEEAKKAYAKTDIKLIRVREIQKDCKRNPEWKKYNDLMNEGEEGYNPHPEFIWGNDIETIWTV